MLETQNLFQLSQPDTLPLSISYLHVQAYPVWVIQRYCPGKVMLRIKDKDEFAKTDPDVVYR